MKIVWLLAAAIVSCSIAAPAYAFHPADETYGYVPPKKFDRKHRVTAQQRLTAAFRNELGLGPATERACRQ